MITCICTGKYENEQIDGKKTASHLVERRKTTPQEKKVEDKKVNISFLPKAQSRKAIIILLRH